MSIGWQAEERLFLTHGDGRDDSASGKRYFTRGGVKYALLELLRQESMHGYQMMKHLEEQSGGTYKPSAGAIYPTLQMLRDQGFVSSFKQEGKKVFEITDEGKAFLDEEREGWPKTCEDRSIQHVHVRSDEHNIHEHEGEDDSGRMRNRRLTPAGKELLHLLKGAERAAMQDETKAELLRDILIALRRSLRELTGGM